MNRRTTVILVFLVGGSWCALPAAEESYDASELGLSKSSVFATPAPEPFRYSEQFPGGNTPIPLSYNSLPALIPHKVESFVPITARNNQCLDCHDRSDQIGKKADGGPTPIPGSHYTDLRSNPDHITNKLMGSRYVCTQCHVPQADVKVLVETNF